LSKVGAHEPVLELNPDAARKHPRSPSFEEHVREILYSMSAISEIASDDLLQHDLLRGSYVPKQEQRDLRGLTRYPVRLTEDKVRLANRIQEMLEDANIKLAAVATDVLEVSIAVAEDDPEKLAQMARKGLRKKLPQYDCEI